MCVFGDHQKIIPSSVSPLCSDSSPAAHLKSRSSRNFPALAAAQSGGSGNQLYDPSNGNTVYYNGPGGDESYVTDTGNNDVPPKACRTA